MFELLKKKFDYIYEHYGNHVIWFVLALQAIIIAITSYE